MKKSFFIALIALSSIALAFSSPIPNELQGTWERNCIEIMKNKHDDSVKSEVQYYGKLQIAADSVSVYIQYNGKIIDNKKYIAVYEQDGSVLLFESGQYFRRVKMYTNGNHLSVENLDFEMGGKILVGNYRLFTKIK